MTSSVMQIEVSSVCDVKTDDAALTVTLADGRVISTHPEWYPRLAYGTPAERSEWQLNAGGEGIHWPLLDEDLSVEGLIAGRKSGEGASSLKRWMGVQDQLRKTGRTFSQRRRDVLRTGPLAAAEIVRLASATVDAYGESAEQWRVLVSDKPFEWLVAHGFNEKSSIVVYEAVTPAPSYEAKKDCIAAGFVGLIEEMAISGSPAFLILHSTSTV